MAKKLDYVPMPDNVVQLVEKTWTEEIKGGGDGLSGSERTYRNIRTEVA